jgi:hypothetical protein
VLSKIDGAMSGGLDPSTGDVSLDIPLRHRIYLGLAIDSPCPRCVAGACTGGQRNGLACTVDASDETFGDVSYDCPPSAAGNISGTGLLTNVEYTTGAASMPFGNTCDAPLGFLNCACGSCSLNTALTCNTTAECSAVFAGVCNRGTGNPRQPNGCDDLVCSPDVETGEGKCNAGPDDKFCDGFTSSNGAGIVQCLSNGDCDASDPACPGGDCGNCTITRTRNCFLDPIAAQGTPGETIVSVGCIGNTANAAVNGVLGWPGAYRVKQSLGTDLLCADGVTEYAPPGGSNCP